MTVTERLFAATEEIWEAYYNHPFVQGIKDGTLPREKFRYYLIQDYLYLVDYAKVFALGAAKSQDMATMHMFASHCKSILDYELAIHNGYMPLLGVDQEELDTIPMSMDNAAYTAYMLRVAYEEGPEAILAAILSCSISYEILAKRMVEEDPSCVEDNFYGEWIRDYASMEYAADDLELIECTDRLTKDYTEEQYKHLEEIFIKCSRFETQFWNMGWEMKE